ncbi:MAG: hypothetical protein ABI333_25945 [bacterium]
MRRKILLLGCGVIVASLVAFATIPSIVQATVTGYFVCDEDPNPCGGGIVIDNGSSIGLNVTGTGTGSSSPVYITQTSTSAVNNYAIRARNNGTGSTAKYGIEAYSYSTNGSKIGLYGYAGGAGTSNTGVSGYATGATTNYGIEGYATGAGNYAGYFTGDVQVNTGDFIAASGSEYAFSAARTFYYNTPATAMVAGDDDSDDKVSRTYSSGGYAYVSSGSSPYGPLLYHSVNLPNGATVSQVYCNVYDNDDSGYVYVYLMRTNRTSSYDTMAYGSTSSAGVPGLTTIDDTSISYADINNASYNYFLLLALRPSAVGTAKIRFYNCRISFQVTEVKF